MGSGCIFSLPSLYLTLFFNVERKWTDYTSICQELQAVALSTGRSLCLLV